MQGRLETPWNSRCHELGGGCDLRHRGKLYAMLSGWPFILAGPGWECGILGAFAMMCAISQRCDWIIQSVNGLGDHSLYVPRRNLMESHC